MFKKLTKLETVVEIALFIVIGFSVIRPIQNFDFWFHIKYGQYIWQTHTLPFIDVFSHTAFGQPAVPYEWLFQLSIYLIFKLTGAIGVQAFVVICALLYAFIFRQILKSIFHLSLFPRFFLTGSLLLINYEFFVERPQSVAFVMFMATLFVVLKYVFQRKNYLFLTPIFFLIWTNLHASMILGLYLLWSFSGIFLFKWLLDRKKDDFLTFRTLFVFGLINFALTIFPPLGTKVYELLLLFFQKRDFISHAIDEWVPLSGLAERFYLYLIIIAASISSFLFALIRLKVANGKNVLKSKVEFLLPYAPFLPLSLFVISGVRQSPFALPVTFLIATPAIYLMRKNSPPILKVIGYITVSAFLIWGFWTYKSLYPNLGKNYPSDESMRFIKTNLKGNMFNEFFVGGYIMYKLGPDIKTYIDGRTDMFLPTILPEYIKVAGDTKSDDETYMRNFTKLMDKYRVSWAILTTNRYSLSWRLSRLLGNDPKWQLVFFDDRAYIYVRKNGQNTTVLEKYGLKVITPQRKSLYLGTDKDLAQLEYEKMNSLSPSATSTNALGFLALQRDDFNLGKGLFEKALRVNPDAAAPKMNLAELAAKDGDYETAIKLYREAISNEPDRGLAYLRLGELIIQSGGNHEDAVTVWKQGLAATPDEEILKKINHALLNNQ